MAAKATATNPRPEMNRYVKIRRVVSVREEYRIELVVGVQRLQLAYRAETRRQAGWMRGMLSNALAAIAREAKA